MVVGCPDGEDEMSFTIVVGYDGSPGATAALDEAIDLARRVSGKVTVANAYGGPRTYAGVPLTPRSALKELGEKVLNDAIEHGRQSGVPLEPVLVNDSVAPGLLEVAHERDADLIVVGTHGESQLSGMLLGSTAYRLVHLSTRPVMVVPAPKERVQRAA